MLVIRGKNQKIISFSSETDRDVIAYILWLRVFKLKGELHYKEKPGRVNQICSYFTHWAV